MALEAHVHRWRLEEANGTSFVMANCGCGQSRQELVTHARDLGPDWRNATTVSRRRMNFNGDRAKKR